MPPRLAKKKEKAEEGSLATLTQPTMLSWDFNFLFSVHNDAKFLRFPLDKQEYKGRS